MLFKAVLTAKGDYTNLEIGTTVGVYGIYGYYRDAFAVIYKEGWTGLFAIPVSWLKPIT